MVVTDFAAPLGTAEALMPCPGLMLKGVVLQGFAVLPVSPPHDPVPRASGSYSCLSGTHYRRRQAEKARPAENGACISMDVGNTVIDLSAKGKASSLLRAGVYEGVWGQSLK